MKPAAVDALYRETYLDVHKRWLESQARIEEMLG
jgi:hypothetical protein